MFKIVQAPDPVLSQKAKPVGKLDKSIHNLITEMLDTLLHAKDPEGVGLAAPQIGKSLQLFIIKPTPRSPLSVFINPEIVELIDEQVKEESAKEKREKAEKGVQLEGCLSLFNIWGVVNRHSKITLSYQDEKWVRHKKTFDGFIAVIIQHEYDHLQGVLFPKRVLEQNNKLYKSSKNEEGETEFEEIEI